ncbi:MAG: LPS export ABC transporter periplasmic protein LptC [Desulfobacterales bacterium]|nr:LPS export ABC transporter periplasmic protein LptC [Desulfobacterales bacterium]
MSNIRTVLFCLIGLMLAGLGVGWFSYHSISNEPEVLLSDLPKNRDISLSHIRQVATRDGVNEWILEAESAQYQKAENKTSFNDISATFFLKDGRTVHLASRDGVLLTDTKDMEVSGGVVLRSGAYELKTERLRYDCKNRSISTDTPVFVKAKGIRLSGHSMIFYLNTEQAVVSGGVEAVFANLRPL